MEQGTILPGGRRKPLRTLIFHPALAPYRIDLFNRLDDKLNLRIAFLNAAVHYHQDLNQNGMRAHLRCDHRYLATNWRICNREFPFCTDRIIREYQPDVVVTSEVSLYFLSLFLFRKREDRRNFGHVLWTEENLSIFKKRNLVELVVRKTCMRNADSLIVCTNAFKSTLSQTRQWVADEKVFVCGNHQDEVLFRKRLELARPLTLDHIRNFHLRRKKVILYVGRLAREKNLTSLLTAFAKVLQSDTGLVLAIVGSGPQRSSLRSRARYLGIDHRVVFVGHQEGACLYAWYLLGAMLVLPSTWEPYGGVVNEALLAGVPVLCSSRVGAKELIRDGENGRIFDPTDIDSLARLMNQMLVKSKSVELIGESIRKSLMPIPFDHDIRAFVQAVEFAAGRKMARTDSRLKSKS